MRGRADVARMLAEEFAHHLAQRAPAGAALALEHERDLRLLVGMLHGPRQEVDDVVVDVVIARSEDLVNVLAQQRPIAAPARHAPAGPEVELAVDDGLTPRLEHDAGILPPIFVREPELADVHKLAVRRDVAIEIQIAEVLEAQKCRHAVDVVLTAGIVLDLFEPQHPDACAVEHDAVVAVEFGHYALGLGLRRWCRFRVGLLGSLMLLSLSRVAGRTFSFSAAALRSRSYWTIESLAKRATSASVAGSPLPCPFVFA